MGRAQDEHQDHRQEELIDSRIVYNGVENSKQEDPEHLAELVWNQSSSLHRQYQSLKSYGCSASGLICQDLDIKQ